MLIRSLWSVSLLLGACAAGAYAQSSSSNSGETAENRDADSKINPHSDSRGDRVRRSNDESERFDNRNANNRRNQSSQYTTRDRDRDNRSYGDRDNDSSRDRGRTREARQEWRDSEERDGWEEDSYGIEFSSDEDGLTIADVSEDSLGSRIGLREGDEIISVNGMEVDSPRNFQRRLGTRSGQRVPIVVRRDSQRRTVYWTVNQSGQRGASASDEQWSNRDEEFDDEERNQQREAFLGVDFDTRYRDAVVVRRVHPNSPAQRSGVRAGDTILTINGDFVDSGEEVSELVSDMDPGEEIDLQVSHAPPRTIQVRLSSRQLNDQAEDDRSYDDREDDREAFGRVRTRTNGFGRN